MKDNEYFSIENLKKQLIAENYIFADISDIIDHSCTIYVPRSDDRTLCIKYGRRKDDEYSSFDFLNLYTCETDFYSTVSAYIGASLIGQTKSIEYHYPHGGKVVPARDC